MAESTHKVFTKRSPRPLIRVPVVRNHPTHIRHTPTNVNHLASVHLQPSLKVGAANDPLEREAENTAERIVSMPSPEIAPPMATPSSGSEGQSGIGTTQRATMDDQPNTDTLEATPPIPADHQDPEVPKEEDVDTTGLTPDDMKEIESGEPEDTAGEPPAEETPPPPEDQPVAQPSRSSDEAIVGAEGGAAPADVAGRVSQPGRGRPLPKSVRTFMEPRFGKDFSDVRIHDARDDRRAAQRIGARAFTHRQHIWIGPDESVENRRLMAHELTHVVQQTKRSPVPIIKREMNTTEDSGEPEVRRGYTRNKAEKYARKIPGYRLISVILGKSPITGDRVERNATNLLGALMALIPGGGELFDRLMETRVIQEAFEWIDERLTRLNINWTRIKSIISDIIDYLMDWPSDVIAYAKKKFAPLVHDIITFIGEVKDKILEFIIHGALKLAGPWAEKIWGIIKKAGSVIGTILKDPLGFAKNLFSSVIKGFQQFRSNIITHIKKGLLGWLFGAIKGLDIQIPEKLDFKGLISIGLQIVGLTYANFRQKLVKQLGANGERKVAYLEKSVEVVKILVKEGFVGLWQRVLQMIDNFKQTMIDGIQKFVIESLIKGGISWLAGLSNPAGAVVKVVLAIYNIIKTFLERLNQILEVANSIFSSIGAIAAGKIEQAADFIEKTIASTIPVVISFLAALVPITGITNSIRGIIKSLKTSVDNAINKMITFFVKKAKKLFSKIIGKLNKKRNLPSVNFKIGKAQHRIYGEKKGKKVQTMIASCKGRPIEQVDEANKVEAKKFKGEEAKNIGDTLSGTVSEADDKTQRAENQTNLSSKKDNQNKPMKKVEKEYVEAGKKMEEAGKGAATNEEVNEEEGCDGPLFRFKEPRDPKVEGQTGTYAAMRKIVEQSENTTKRSGGSFYEVDHMIEKQIPKAILDNLHKLGPKKSSDSSSTILRIPDPNNGSDRAAAAGKQLQNPVPFGKIGSKAVLKIAKDAPQFPAIILYRPNHVDKGVTKTSDVMQWIEDASITEDPPRAMKDRLQVQLNEEREKVAKAYQQDAGAGKAIGDKINEGLRDIQPLNSDMYGLGKDEADNISDANEKSDNAKSKSSLAFDSTDPANPDFDDIEGKYEAHSSLPTPPGVGKYLEKDHIVEKSFPVHAQKLTLGSASLGAQINSAEPQGENRPPEDLLKAHKDELREAKIYNSGGVEAYTERAGKALLMYRPIHRVVSKVSKGARRTDDILPRAIPPSVSTATQAYLMSGTKADIDKIRNAIKPGIREKVIAATEVHARKVESEYDKEIQNVKSANADGGPGAQDRAAAKMQKIINKVKRNLSQARNYTGNLFS